MYCSVASLVTVFAKHLWRSPTYSHATGHFLHGLDLHPTLNSCQSPTKKVMSEQVARLGFVLLPLFLPRTSHKAGTPVAESIPDQIKPRGPFVYEVHIRNLQAHPRTETIKPVQEAHPESLGQTADR